MLFNYIYWIWRDNRQTPKLGYPADGVSAVLSYLFGEVSLERVQGIVVDYTVHDREFNFKAGIV